MKRIFFSYHICSIADSQEIVPTFRLAQCEVDGDLCIKVTFADREEDLIVADEYITPREMLIMMSIRVN